MVILDGLLTRRLSGRRCRRSSSLLAVLLLLPLPLLRSTTSSNSSSTLNTHSSSTLNTHSSSTLNTPSSSAAILLISFSLSIPAAPKASTERSELAGLVDLDVAQGGVVGLPQGVVPRVLGRAVQRLRARRPRRVRRPVRQLHQLREPVRPPRPPHDRRAARRRLRERAPLRRGAGAGARAAEGW